MRCHGSRTVYPSGAFGSGVTIPLVSYTGSECGRQSPHEGHDFTDGDRRCSGSLTGFPLAACGVAGGHGEHLLRDVAS